MDIVVHKGRTKVVKFQANYDLSGDSITSQIRVAANRSSPLIAEWDVEFATDGSDGIVILRLDDTVTAEISHRCGYMDIKRCIGGPSGDPVQMFDDPLQVVFKEVVTD